MKNHGDHSGRGRELQEDLFQQNNRDSLVLQKLENQQYKYQLDNNDDMASGPRTGSASGEPEHGGTAEAARGISSSRNPEQDTIADRQSDEIDFIHLACQDQDTLEFVKICQDQYNKLYGVTRCFIDVIRTFFRMCMSNTDVNGLLGTGKMWLCSAAQFKAFLTDTISAPVERNLVAVLNERGRVYSTPAVGGTNTTTPRRKTTASKINLARRPEEEHHDHDLDDFCAPDKGKDHTALFSEDDRKNQHQQAVQSQSEQFKYFFEPGGHLLDIGSGCGYITEQLLPLFSRVTCTEVSKQMVKRLERMGNRKWRDLLLKVPRKEVVGDVDQEHGDVEATSSRPEKDETNQQETLSPAAAAATNHVVVGASSSSKTSAMGTLRSVPLLQNSKTSTPLATGASDVCDDIAAGPPNSSTTSTLKHRTTTAGSQISDDNCSTVSTAATAASSSALLQGTTTDGPRRTGGAAARSGVQKNDSSISTSPASTSTSSPCSSSKSRQDNTSFTRSQLLKQGTLRPMLTTSDRKNLQKNTSISTSAPGYNSPNNSSCPVQIFLTASVSKEHCPALHDPQQKFSLITSFNVLDRCEKPITLLKEIHSLCKQHNCKFLLSAVFPFEQWIEDHVKSSTSPSSPKNGRSGGANTSSPNTTKPHLSPSFEKVSYRGQAHMRTFEEQAAGFARAVLMKQCGFRLLKFARAPYISAGSANAPVYILSNGLFLLEPI
ncbi:unnamed protein product [Amoebophrya sp. A120]|nr:unnamed protein product [Amoebophrya sp. A120]|eukprot:GSA120T00006886001.1